MKMNRKFNVRVYGLWIKDGCVLVNEELIREKKITKFPGGGLEFGEGTHDCLRREWMEELGLAPEVLEHFYTTDFFQPSAYDDSQILSIYYYVRVQGDAVLDNKNDNEKTFWLDMETITDDTFTLPIDKKVGVWIRQLHTGF